MFWNLHMMTLFSKERTCVYLASVELKCECQQSNQIHAIAVGKLSFYFLIFLSVCLGCFVCFLSFSLCFFFCIVCCLLLFLFCRSVCCCCCSGKLQRASKSGYHIISIGIKVIQEFKMQCKNALQNLQDLFKNDEQTVESGIDYP